MSGAKTPLTKDELDAVIEVRLHELAQRRSRLKIHHDGFERALRFMAEAHRHALIGNDRRGVMVTGESRTGKTTLLELYASRYPDDEFKGKPRRRVVLISFPSATTQGQVMSELLDALGDAFPDRGTIKVRTRRFKTYVAELGVEMLLFDEAQHLVGHNGPAMLESNADWLKQLMGTGVACVLVGQSTATRFLTESAQVRNRFLAPLKMEPFNAFNETSLQDLQALLTTIGETYPSDDSLKIHRVVEARRFLLATDGFIGLIVDLVERASEYAIRDGRTGYLLTDLADAWTHYINTPVEGVGNPFEADASRITECFLKGWEHSQEATVTPMKKRYSARKPKTKTGDVLKGRR